MCISRRMIVLILFVMTCVCVPKLSLSEDIDAFAPSVKSNAMLVVDTSGSMRWPVYNHNIDYKSFFEWAVSSGYAIDDGGLGISYESIPWVKNKVYLVSAYLGYSEITGSQGEPYSVFGDPIYEGSNRRQKWVTGGIIDTGWSITDWNDVANNTISTDVSGYVVYPDLSGQTSIGSNVHTVGYASSDITGHRLFNNQNRLMTDVRTDPRTNISKDYGMMGYLRSAGLYFSGLFETGAWYTLTNDPDVATTDDGRHRVYAFVTGNFLSFIKLIEDMEDTGVCNLSGSGWENICYQPSATPWAITDVGPVRNTQYPYDYSSNRNEEHFLVNLNQFSGIKRVAFYFSTLDIENNSDGSGCSCWSSNSNNDGVQLVTNTGRILKQSSQLLPETGDGKLFGCDKSGWTGYYDVSDQDSVYAKFYVGPDGGNVCSGSDSGFRITKIKWTTESADTNASVEGSFSCCNGGDGVGQKIFSRLEVVQQAMNQVVEDTADKINWGVFRWSGSSIEGKAQFGSSVATIKSAMNSLTPDGGTPMGEGMQEAYDYGYDYLAAHTDLSECSKNYLLVLTDGFPSGDDSWSRISKDDDDPNFSDSAYHDSDSWGGDPTQGYGNVANYSDDVARWLYNSTEADFNYTSHTIGFGLENPLLQDIATESAGLHLTAYDQEQLVNAFYSLGLSMTDAVSFTAPAISVDQANRAQSGNELYMAFFKPVTDDYWQGNLKRYYLKWYANGTEEVLDAGNASATTPEGLFKDTARSYWSVVQDGGQVDKGGAGALLKNHADSWFTLGNYYQRAIKTWKNGQMVDFTAATMNATDFGMENVSDVHEIVNFMHGYAFDADTNGNPVGPRPWILGDIIHSEPIVLDYVDSTNARSLIRRHVIVGANDAMLHVFDSQTGLEELAFVPPDLWSALPEFSDLSQHVYGVDGYLTKYQVGRNPDLLLFGERRGGSNYWALDCSNSDPAYWTVAWSIAPTGEFAELGQSWSEMVVARDVVMENATESRFDLGVFCGGYDPTEDDYNGTLPAADTKGRGIFVVNLLDGSLVFKASYGVSNATSSNGTSTSITRTDMNFCFPGSPTVITHPEAPDGQHLVIYAIDIASQVWKVAHNGSSWFVSKLFASNGPEMAGGASAPSGLVDKLDGFRDYDSSDRFRKCFATPEVSYAGDCSTDRPVIYFGTGDKAQPKSSAVSNRFYAVFDMSHNASMLPLDETDLLNITCDELDSNGTLTADEKNVLKATLGDDYKTQAQGWYIVLDGQDDCPLYYGNMSHDGEKITNAARLFNKKIYFNSYIPTTDDPCNPKGIALFYALGYCFGESAFELEPNNSGKSVSDRYFSVSESTPPSPINLISGPGGGVILKASAGSKIINRYLESDLGTHLYWWKYADENQ
ncbi:pilus assembly protein [Desulfoplanes sp. PS50]